VVLGEGPMKRAASVLRALRDLVGQAESTFTRQRAQRQDLKDMAVVAPCRGLLPAAR
jgi:hypothetical protein